MKKKDILEDFDPNSFVRLKQVINDITQIKSFRKLALEIYCEKFNDDQSFNLLLGILDDSELCYDAENYNKKMVRNKLSTISYPIIN